MTSMMCDVMDNVMFTSDKMTELVRGQDTELMQRVAPLVREHNVSLDLRAVERIDAAGIAALISLYGLARNAGHQFAVANASARVQGILALVGLDRILLSQYVIRDSHSDDCRERPAA